MNRRAALKLFGLAPVAGVMAARDAMAAVPSDSISHLFGSFEFTHGESFIGETHGESPVTAARRALNGAIDTFGVDDIAPTIPVRPAEDESVSAQFESDLAFIRDEPGVVS